MDFHTNDAINAVTAAEATDFTTNPVTWRFSCNANDVVTDTSVPRLAGCNLLDGWTTDTDTCMVQYEDASTNRINLCACDCGSADKEAKCHYGGRGTWNAQTYPFLRATAKQAALPAGALLSQRNRDLFRNNGVYDMIATLKNMTMLQPLMPEGSFGFYQVGSM